MKKAPVATPEAGKANACNARRPHDTDAFCVITTAPTPELLTAVGHAILRSVAIGQGDILRHAADAIGRLDKLLPNASAEARLVATLLAISSDPTPREETMVQSPTPTPVRRKSKSGKTSRPTCQAKPAHPLMDASGRLLSSRKINDTAVISQAEARKVLVMNCPQMIKLENQKLLTRIQESGSRLVYYDVCQVQKLLDLIDRGADPQPDDDDDATDPVA